MYYYYYGIIIRRIRIRIRIITIRIMIMILIITKSTEEVKIMLIVHWSYEDGASGTYQGSLGLKKGMCIRSVRESMPVRLCKNTEERIGHLARFIMT